MTTTKEEQYKEECRVTLRDSIVNTTRKIEFVFTSRYDTNNESFITDDDKNRGNVVIKDLINGKEWTATYYLTFFSDEICHLNIHFNEFKLNSTDLIGNYEANTIGYRFDEMIKYLKTEFPPLPLVEEIS